MTISVYFAAGVVEELKKIRFNDLRISVQKKAEALILHAYNVSTKEIASILDVCENTICSYLNEFNRTGFDGLLEGKSRVKTGELEQYKDIIEFDFRKKPPRTSNEAVKRIEELTGLKRGKTQVKIFLKSLGMIYRKTAVIPAKADVNAQEEFKKNSRASD